MLWYYVDKGSRLEPFTDEEMKALVHEGKVSSGTPVWHDGMTKWQTWKSVRRGNENEPAIDSRSIGKNSEDNLKRFSVDLE